MSWYWLFWILWFWKVVVFGYFVSLNAFYGLLLFLSIRWCDRYRRGRIANPLDFHNLENLKNLVPPVALIVPAYNEERVIVESVRSLLAICYPRIEIVVVNDGSKDHTLDELIRSFSLRLAEVKPAEGLATQAVRGIYVSMIEPRLIVVDKQNGGKADALNAGINHCQSPYFLSIDADSLLEPDALTLALRVILEDPERVVAVGGVVRGVNGSIVDAGRVRRVTLRWNFWIIIQALEYVRSFMAGRAGWSEINGVLIVPGAFGLFQKVACIRAGGYSPESVAEDLELVVRLHRCAREHHFPWRIVFAPDAVCWTELPTTGRALGRQRRRWHEGLWQTVARHHELCFNTDYGVVGFLSLPHQIFHELVGPLVELTSLILFPLLYVFGLIHWQELALYLALAFFLGTLVSMAAILIDQTYFPRYRFPRDVMPLLVFSLVENFGYRQLTMVWRLMATWNFFFGKITWSVSTRTGFATKID